MISPRPSYAQMTSAFSPHRSRLSSDLTTAACTTVGYFCQLLDISAARRCQVEPYPHIPNGKRVMGDGRKEVASSAWSDGLDYRNVDRISSRDDPRGCGRPVHACLVYLVPFILLLSSDGQGNGGSGHHKYGALR